MRVDQDLIQWLIDGALGIGMFLFKNHADNVKDRHDKLLAAHDALEKEVTNVKVSYVPKEDMKALREEINSRFDRLEDLIRK